MKNLIGLNANALQNYHQPLLPGKTYHIFNRAIGNEQLFLTSNNYNYFLKKYAEHLSKLCATYCYCLLPNHFHFMVRINEDDSIADHYRLSKKTTLNEIDQSCLSDFVMERFSNLLNGYTKAFNKMNSRRGGLFLDFTKRAMIEDDDSFSKLIHYIHANPVHHGICKRIEDWKHSSYNSLLSNQSTRLLRNEVIDWFGSKSQFIEFHSQPIQFKSLDIFE